MPTLTYGHCIHLHDQEWLEKQRIAGKVAAGAISMLVDLAKSGTSKTLSEMDVLTEEYIRDNKCIPTFKDYVSHGSTPFPNSCCFSPNNLLVHGVATDYVLQEGDIISFDLGATYPDENGAIADTATTIIIGQPKDHKHMYLISDTERALELAIKSIKIGERLGIIGETIYDFGKYCGYEVVVRYGGHGIGNAYDGKALAHTPPFVANKSQANNGIRFQKGASLAIEPLFTLAKTNETYIGDNGWDVYCQDVAAHFEHSIYLHEDGSVEVITAREEFPSSIKT
jgi:methionyl aminopeptidase